MPSSLPPGLYGLNFSYLSQISPYNDDGRHGSRQEQEHENIGMEKRRKAFCVLSSRAPLLRMLCFGLDALLPFLRSCRDGPGRYVALDSTENDL